MSVWDTYEHRMEAYGTSPRDMQLRRELHRINTKLPNTLSYHSVLIDGTAYDVGVTNTDNLDTKFLYTTTPSLVTGGELVEWMNNHWLVVECDVNTELYTKAKLQQCNHLLKWVDENRVIHEQWCIIRDGTKYLTGEYEDRQFIVTRGDSRITMTIARNTDTVKFGREHRFLIDDTDVSEKLAYALTKPLKVGTVFNNKGVFSFVLQEVVSTDDDNQELGIADYYKYFPKENTQSTEAQSDTEPTDSSQDTQQASSGEENGRRVWL